MHGQVTRRAEGYAYQDLKSTNGSAVERQGRKTAVDGVEVVHFPLQEQDRILLGSEEMRQLPRLLLQRGQGLDTLTG